MKSYTTIALFGLDNRSNGNLSKGRSDVIMIANINNDTKEVKLCSVFRDSYLDTGDGSFKKCNAAYAKGGPEAAINMLNKNLDLSITDYVTVDFNAVVECVDLLGGITLVKSQMKKQFLCRDIWMKSINLPRIIPSIFPGWWNKRDIGRRTGMRICTNPLYQRR